MYDYTGHKNLEIVSSRHRLNDWMYEQFSSVLNGDILEVGSGVGVFSERIIEDIKNSNKTLTLTDSSFSYIDDLQKKFSKQSNVFYYKLNLDCKDDYDALGYCRFDTIMVVNVIEHVRNDDFAFKQLHRMLKKNGTLVVLVPCYKFLYNVIDRSIGHYRRYTKEEIMLKLQKSAFLVKAIKCYNLAGILGWYINGNVLQNSELSTSALTIYDRLVPLWKFLDRLTLRRIGLSIICYVMKP